MRRLHQTLADYVVIAISPALIMALVGSLVFFLLQVFYQGQFQTRLHWVMACFVFAIVLIGRISIEEGFQRAAPFGIVLAILVGIAANRFMQYQGTWVDNFSWLINFTLIAIVWGCAHQLTWDCTVIDDSQDSSGEGLMQLAGLERPADQRNTVPEANLEGTTSREVPASYWQRYVEHQRRPHAPGVWVVYFSLAALPIFGLGQWLIPAAAVGRRRYAFLLLCVYVAAGLGLLLTTSFLGLRRYLRQRRIEMPTLMANLWLGTGVAIAVALLVVAALLPRPSAEYEIAQLPFKLGSPLPDTSRAAPVESEGVDDQQQRGATEPSSADQQPTNSRQPDQAVEGQPASSASGEQSGEQSGEPSDSATQQNDTENSAGSASGNGQGEGGKGSAARDSSPANEQRQSEPGASQPREEGEQREKSAANDAGSKLPSALKNRRQQQEQLAGERSAETQSPSEAQQPPETQASEPDSPEPSSSPSTQQVFQAVQQPVTSLIVWLKFAFYVAFALAVLWALWRYRHEVVAAVRGFLVELRAWWAGLFGGKRSYGVAADMPLDIRPPPAAFSSFADPFASGLADRCTPQELVRYSFEAFEAWSNEHGCPRGPEQTPHELARDVTRLNKPIAAEARSIAELYARAAYSRGELPADSSQRLRELWAKMRVAAGTRIFTADELRSWS